MSDNCHQSKLNFHPVALRNSQSSQFNPPCSHSNNRYANVSLAKYSFETKTTDLMTFQSLNIKKEPHSTFFCPLTKSKHQA